MAISGEQQAVSRKSTLAALADKRAENEQAGMKPSESETC